MKTTMTKTKTKPTTVLKLVAAAYQATTISRVASPRQVRLSLKARAQVVSVRSSGLVSDGLPAMSTRYFDPSYLCCASHR